MSSTPPPPPPDPAVLAALSSLIGLTTTQNGLIAATNAILLGVVGGGGGLGGGGGGGGGGGRSGATPPPGGELSSLFDKHFGTKESKYVDPQKGLGRWAGTKMGQIWKGSRTRASGREGAKFGRGAVRSVIGSGGAKTGIGKMLMSAGEALGGAVGKVIPFIGNVVDMLQKAYGALVKFTDKAMESAARLGEIEGGMAAVTASREIDQIGRDLQRGRATSGSAAELQKSESARKAEENKLGASLDNATNQVLTLLNNLVTPIIEKFNILLGGLKEMRFVGDTIKKLLEGGGEISSGTFGDIGSRVTDDVAALEARAETLLERARIAAGAGAPAPAGAAPPGGLP